MNFTDNFGNLWWSKQHFAYIIKENISTIVVNLELHTKLCPNIANEIRFNKFLKNIKNKALTMNILFYILLHGCYSGFQ